jgi:sterol desaturase/sphingolipid hydroxylase (fatty acid hydroxylase superfamily)
MEEFIVAKEAAHEVNQKRKAFAKLASWGFYPLVLSVTLIYIYLEIQGTFGMLGRAYPIYLALIIGFMLLLEWMIPLRLKWSMTWRTWSRRDLPMLVINGVAIFLTTRAITFFAEWINGGHIVESHFAPWWVEAVLTIYLSDFIWYWVHRYCHEGKGRFGGWLWRTHVMHHLPEQVYVFMHVVGHPLNGAYVRVILMLPVIVFGFSKEAVFAAAVMNGFQSLIAHFNVNVRAGWFNYFVMGTELHRYHHSAEPMEGKNYAAVVTLWDQLFGTFEYHPGLHPNALGMYDRASYPSDGQWLALLRLPFWQAKK